MAWRQLNGGIIMAWRQYRIANHGGAERLSVSSKRNRKRHQYQRSVAAAAWQYQQLMRQRRMALNGAQRSGIGLMA